MRHPFFSRLLAAALALGVPISAHAARVLQPGGRLVWISALPEVTRAAAARAGLRETHRSPIEMGCLRTELEVYHKP